MLSAADYKESPIEVSLQVMPAVPQLLIDYWRANDR